MTEKEKREARREKSRIREALRKKFENYSDVPKKGIPLAALRDDRCAETPLIYGDF